MTTARLDLCNGTPFEHGGHRLISIPIAPRYRADATASNRTTGAVRCRM